MPELPAAMRARFVNEYALPEYDSLVLTASTAMANYFVAVVDAAGKENAKAAANWLMGDVSSTLNREGVDIADSPVKPAQLALIVGNEVDGVSHRALEAADVHVQIRMQGKKESLNVSVAAGIALAMLRSRIDKSAQIA